MHPLFVVHHLAGADADQDVVRVVMAALEEMHVVRRDQTEAEFLRELRQDAIAFALRLDAVVVQLEEEILRAEDVAESRRALRALWPAGRPGSPC